MQITITIREIANGFLVSDQYGELHGFHDARPVETFYDSETALLNDIRYFTENAMQRQRDRDEAYRAEMSTLSDVKNRSLRGMVEAQRSAPVASGYRGQPVGFATPPDDGDPHLDTSYLGPVVTSGDCSDANAREVDESAEFIRDKPVMDTSAFGQRDKGDPSIPSKPDEGPAEK
jgi:hypothetical protein